MTKPRPEKLPDPGKVHKELDRIKLLSGLLYDAALELSAEYRLAYESSLSPSSNGDPPSLGRGFVESDPTGETATNGRLHHLRSRATKASRKVSHALTDCAQALGAMNTGFNLAFDDEEWARWVEETLAEKGL